MDVQTLRRERKKKKTPSLKSSLDLTIYTCGRTRSRKFSSCVKFFSPANGSLNLELSCQQRDSESEYRKRVRKRVKLPQNLEVGRRGTKWVSFVSVPTSKK